LLASISVSTIKFLFTGVFVLLFGREYSSSEVSVLFHDIRFVIELAVDVAVVLRGGGGGLLSVMNWTKPLIAVRERKRCVRVGMI